MPGGNKMSPGGGGWRSRFCGYGGWVPPWPAGNPFWGPYACGWGFAPPGAPSHYAPQYSREMEVEFLKGQAAYLERCLKDIKERLRELGEE